MMKLNRNAFLSVALICFGALGLTGCNTAGSNTANNTTAANSGNTAVVTNKPANAAAPANTAPANTTTASTAGDKIGVPECDEYVEKYEACLTSIGEKYPQVQPSLKTAFEAQRKGFKDAAATPQGKAALASGCKQAMETAKQSTSAYACKW